MENPTQWADCGLTPEEDVPDAQRESHLGATTRTRGRSCAIPGSELLPYLYNPDKPRMEAVIPREDTAPHGVETPPPLADYCIAWASIASGTQRRCVGRAARVVSRGNGIISPHPERI